MNRVFTWCFQWREIKLAVISHNFSTGRKIFQYCHFDLFLDYTFVWELEHPLVVSNKHTTWNSIIAKWKNLNRFVEVRETLRREESKGGWRPKCPQKKKRRIPPSLWPCRWMAGKNSSWCRVAQTQEFRDFSTTWIRKILFLVRLCDLLTYLKVGSTITSFPF